MVMCGGEAGAFDLVICSMALCHVEDLQSVFDEVRRLLRVGGGFALVDFHPFFLLNGVPSHFEHPGQDRYHF